MEKVLTFLCLFLCIASLVAGIVCAKWHCILVSVCVFFLYKELSNCNYE